MQTNRPKNAKFDPNDQHILKDSRKISLCLLSPAFILLILFLSIMCTKAIHYLNLTASSELKVRSFEGKTVYVINRLGLRVPYAQRIGTTPGRATTDSRLHLTLNSYPGETLTKLHYFYIYVLLSGCTYFRPCLRIVESLE